MRIWHADSSTELPGYSIAKSLLFDIVAQTPSRELSPSEKLFIAENAGFPVHTGYLTDVFMSCGCFAEARALYAEAGHTRKLGDVCWILGKHDEAEKHYSNPESRAQRYRTTPDYDRLLTLAFFRGEWDRIPDLFTDAGFMKGFRNGRVLVGKSETRAKPLLIILAIALAKLEVSASADLLAVLDQAFQLNKTEWEAFVRIEGTPSDRELEKLRRRCIPIPGNKPASSREDALRRGDTSRARHVLDYLRNSEGFLSQAQDELECFGATGDNAALEGFVALVTGSGITSVSHTFLFAAMGHDRFSPRSAPPARLVQLYGCHPIMYRRYFARLLDVKFRHSIVVTTAEILTGLFQQQRSMRAFLDVRADKQLLDVPTLGYFREWA